jgi:hypothetical protein
MNLRWLYFDYFPPEIKLTQNQKLEFAYYMSRRKGLFWAATGIFVVMLLSWHAIIFWLQVTYRFTWPTWLGAPLRALAGLTLAHLAIAVFLRKRRGRIARQALNELGYRVCVECGYWLRGLGKETALCPECGRIVPCPRTPAAPDLTS